MNYMDDVILLLTACINPNGMLYTAIQDTELRKKQYIESLTFYLTQTQYKIVFVENSNIDISHLYQKEISEGRLECITFNGNNFDRSLGKGFGEALILEYAFHHSKFIAQCHYIVKITGRIIVENVLELMGSCLLNKKRVYCELGLREKTALSVFFVAHKDFISLFLSKKDSINDSANCYFEKVLFQSILEWKKGVGHKYNHFYLPIRMRGVSGSTGMVYPYGNKMKALVKYVLYFFLKPFLFS